MFSDNLDYVNYFVDMLIKLKANVDMLIGYKMLCFGTAKSAGKCRKTPPGLQWDGGSACTTSHTVCV